MSENENMVLDEWLTNLNRDFRTQGVDVGQRPFLALKKYCQDFKIYHLAFNSDTANAIFDWFYSNTKREAHHIGSLFTGAFYYDTCFWPVDIFVGYGTGTHLESLPSLQSMPDPIKAEMMAVPRDAWSYTIAWAHSLDYAYGLDDMRKTLPAESRYALSLLENADRELRAATAQLFEPRPNSKAAISCRMATEIFLKAFLVLKGKMIEEELIDKYLRKIGHGLKNSLDKVRELCPEHQLLTVESAISVFPATKDRYTGQELSSSTLWEAYCITMYVASAVTRSFTDRNVLTKILEQSRIAYED